jgi:subtilisin family serine protease
MRILSFHRAAKALTLSATAAAALLVASGAAAGAAGPRLTVVGYTSDHALRLAVAASGGHVVRNLHEIHAAEVEAPPAALRLMSGLPGIRYAQRPVPRHSLVEPALAPAAVPGGAYEWQYAASDEDGVPASVAQAAGALTIAVVDTGADVTAPDLAAKSPSTWSVLSNSSDVTDRQGHGTFVSSLAAGSSTNGEGVAGFGGDTKLLDVQAAQVDGSITDVDSAEGIVYAVDHGANIINMSYGGPTPSTLEQNAVAYAAGHGALLVAAAGNDGGGSNLPMYPAAFLQPLSSNGQGGIGLAVAATNVSGAASSFSNWGSYISLAAPGENVFGAVSSAASSWPTTALPGSSAGLYGYSSGTSFSSPEVAGAAALVWASNPALSATDVAAVLKAAATGNNGVWNAHTGFGRLDVAAAVARAQALLTAPPPVTLTGKRKGSHVDLSWSAPGASAYRLSVTMDGGGTRVLQGSTTATSASYDLDPGHTYAFSVSAEDSYGLRLPSAPYVVSLPQSSAKLTLKASPTRGRSGLLVRLWASLTPGDSTTARSGRSVRLEAFDGSRWKLFGRSVKTSAAGLARWSVRFPRGAYVVRARFAGTIDLAAATSERVSIRVR